MNIKMKTPGRNGNEKFVAGDVISVTKEEGDALVKRGLAVMADESEKPKKAAEKTKPKKAAEEGAGNGDAGGG
ncbi:hypothetical protein LJC42_00285 [Eubacteriales bacterium OttesenSCG-928-K08]|nr:hypothetical protein [Eubacteriales bacterium OttesenSCG-928-K08]